MAETGKGFTLIWNDIMVKETVRRVAIEIIERGLLMIETDAKIFQTPHVDEGILRANIGREIDKDKLEGRAGTNKEYAPYVEFGTGIHAEGGAGRQTPWVYHTKRGFFFTHGNVPMPFLRPAYEKNITEIMAMFKMAFQ